MNDKYQVEFCAQEVVTQMIKGTMFPLFKLIHCRLGKYVLPYALYAVLHVLLAIFYSIQSMLKLQMRDWGIWAWAHITGVRADAAIHDDQSKRANGCEGGRSAYKIPHVQENRAAGYVNTGGRIQQEIERTQFLPPPQRTIVRVQGCSDWSTLR